MAGPCLCGDPYCPHCGNPGAAAWEAFVEEALERFSAELPLFDERGPGVAFGGELVHGGDAIAQALERFLEKNIAWLAERYNDSIE